VDETPAIGVDSYPSLEIYHPPDAVQGVAMSKLLALIDEYKDAHGQPSDASIARAIGVAPQTISSWRQRGIRDAPSVDTMRRLAEFMVLPYREYVLQAVLYDIGLDDYMPTLEEARDLEAQRRAQKQRGAG
jgi:transcriptional regulator with XRE-family HTH domain